MDPCPDVTGTITLYQVRFQTGSDVTTQTVKNAGCTAGRCNYIFVPPPSSSPSSYHEVSVAAENVVGVGAARMCTTQTISEFKFVMLPTSYVHETRLVPCIISYYVSHCYPISGKFPVKIHELKTSKN